MSRFFHERSSAPRTPESWSKIAFRLSRALLIAYIATIGVFYQLQDFLVFPGHYLRAADITPNTLPPGAQIVHMRSRDDQMIEGLFGTALTPQGDPLPAGGGVPTLLYFY